MTTRFGKWCKWTSFLGVGAGSLVMDFATNYQRPFPKSNRTQRCLLRRPINYSKSKVLCVSFTKQKTSKTQSLTKRPRTPQCNQRICGQPANEDKSLGSSSRKSPCSPIIDRQTNNLTDAITNDRSPRLLLQSLEFKPECFVVEWRRILFPSQ